MSADLPVLATRGPADLIAWGKRAIEEAASFIAVREIRDQAEALRAYQRSVGAAQEAIDAAQEIRVRAERRMGQEIAKAQQEGSAATPHRRQKGSDVPTLSELGVKKHHSSEWQQLAAADDEAFNGALATVRGKGTLSPSAVRKALRPKPAPKAKKPQRRVPAPRIVRPVDDRPQRVIALFHTFNRLSELIETIRQQATAKEVGALAARERGVWFSLDKASLISGFMVEAEEERLRLLGERSA